MKKISVLILFFVAFSSFGLYAQAIRLAVTQIEPLGVDQKTARMVEDLLQTELTKIPLFSLVERGRLEGVLQEQELQLSGITSAQSAAQAGNILNVQKVIFGSLAHYNSEYIKYLLSLRMVDVERAVVEAAESVQIRSDEQLLAGVSEIASRLAAKVKIAGKVIGLEGGAVYTSLGTEAGIGPDDTLAVTAIELIKDNSGRILMREEKGIANLVVEKVSLESSRCRILESGASLEIGQAVSVGRIAIEEQKERSTLEVRSVPENANVFLDGTFLGITPLKLSDLEPGSYRIEIRSSAGYKPYQGKLSLKPGRSVSLERELEPEVDVQDILLFGKIPRRRTDPGTALKKALVPGLGAVYNGYSGHMPIILFQLSGLGAGAIQYSLGKGPVNPATILSLSTALLIYGSSIIDAWITASQDFLYPTYSELAITGATAMVQVPGISEQGFGLGFDFTYEGRSIFFQMGLKSAIPFIVMSVCMLSRFIITDHFFAGLGLLYSIDFGAGERGVEEGEERPDHLYSPSLSISYKTTRFEGDLVVSPYAWLNNMGDNKNLLGFRGKADVSYFFGLKAGIRVSAEYANMRDMDSSSDYVMQLLYASAGLVMRL